MSPDDHSEIVRLRERLHEVVNNTAAQLRSMEAELHKLSLHFEREIGDVKREITEVKLSCAALSRQIDEASEDTQSLRKALYTTALSVTGAAVVFAFSIFQVL